MKRLLAHLGYVLAGLTWLAGTVDLVYYKFSDTYSSRVAHIATDSGSLNQILAAIWITLVFLLIYLEED